ncbi:hypothetical protein B0T13DRAFT_456564 [Neurospora crassa]|nr:hypothetical protein B0T13DRAFT_456564 [Neurospora crassa]
MWPLSTIQSNPVLYCTPISMDRLTIDFANMSFSCRGSIELAPANAAPAPAAPAVPAAAPADAPANAAAARERPEP